MTQANEFLSDPRRGAGATCGRRRGLVAGIRCLAVAAGLGFAAPVFGAEAGPLPWSAQPLTLANCVDVALRQNSGVLRGRSDLEAAYGVVIQTRAIAMPKIQATGDYRATDAVEKLPIPIITATGDQTWSANIQVVQTIYQGGRISSALRAAKLTKEQAILQFQTVLTDTVLDVTVAFYDVLLAKQLIVVQEASVKLLGQELEDQKRRLDAGTAPSFNVLRAEVELANARPRLIRARNDYRVAKNNLANLLGYRIPREMLEDVPLELAGRLEAEPWEIDLPTGISQALGKRPELAALRKAESLRREDIVAASGGAKPTVQLFGGYGARTSQIYSDLTRDVHGWAAGAQVSWDIFDGFLTRGKVDQARALLDRSRVDLDDTARRVELEVRTAYSNFIEARELLESQKKNQEQADEALRQANARSEAGTGTQLDVLGAQTALTEARTTQIQALHDYAVARARLERAIGRNVVEPPVSP